MTAFYEGVVEIPLDEFWEFVSKFHDKTSGEVAYGVPKVAKGAGTLNVSFAVGYECHPSEWAEKPPAVTEWDDCK